MPNYAHFRRTAKRPAEHHVPLPDQVASPGTARGAFPRTDRIQYTDARRPVVFYRAPKGRRRENRGSARTLSSRPANQQRRMSRMSLASGEMGDGVRLGAWLGGKERPQASLARGQAHWPCALGLRDGDKICICSNRLDNAIRFFVTEPLHLIEVDQQQPARCSAQLQLLTAQDLAAHFDQNRDYSCRLISICQRNSWQPLQTNKSILDLIVARNSISSQFWDLPSCFYRRNLEVEEAFCVPYTELRQGPITEISYTLKYPEYKPRANEWVIRQTAVHHRFNSTTGQSVYVLFNPVPSSKGHLAALEQLRNHSQETKAEPFWLHRVLFATYFPAWRQYIAALEREFLPIANGVNVAYIDEQLRVGFENLSTTMSLQKRFLQISTLLAPAADVLDAMDNLLKSISQTIANHPGTQQFKNYNRQCVAYSRMATNLQHRSQMTAQLLTDTLSFRDQVVAKQQTENMLQLNKSAVFVTFLTLFYLPASFLTSFFGMNFFGFDQDNDRIASTSMIWIFIISAILLTAITVFIYYWRVQREAKRRLIPRMQIDWNWKSMMCGLEMRKLNLDPTQKDSQA